mgnify:CR=1 FL=1
MPLGNMAGSAGQMTESRVDYDITFTAETHNVASFALLARAVLQMCSRVLL